MITRESESRLSGAFFSDCEKYRYRLWRKFQAYGAAWPTSPRWCNFLMLNPSTADHTANDPTVERCERRARQWRYDGLIVTNLFAYRATNPRELERQVDPIGRWNDLGIIAAASQSQIVICAWGRGGHYMNRAAVVHDLLTRAGSSICRKLHALKTSADGTPWHPLYLSYAMKPFPMLSIPLEENKKLESRKT